MASLDGSDGRKHGLGFVKQEDSVIVRAMFMAKKSKQMRWLDQEPFELYALWTDKDMDGLKRRIREDQSQIRSMKYRLHSSLFFRVFLKRFANRVYAMGILAGVAGAFSHTFYYPHDRKDGDGNG